MIELNNKISVFKPLENKSSKKADIVFNKLLAKYKKPKNPFDEVRSTTYTYANEIKPGEALNETI
jgi:hypothetical protein